MKAAKDFTPGDLISLRLRKPGDDYAKVYEVEVIRAIHEEGDRVVVETAAGGVIVDGDEMFEVPIDGLHVDRGVDVKIDLGPKLKRGQRSTW